MNLDTRLAAMICQLPIKTDNADYTQMRLEATAQLHKVLTPTMMAARFNYEELCILVSNYAKEKRQDWLYNQQKQRDILTIEIACTDLS